MYAVFTLARNSASSPFLADVKPGDSRSVGAEGGPGWGAMAGAAGGDCFEPAQLEAGKKKWLTRDLASRTKIEQPLDPPLDTVFSKDPGEPPARRARDAPPTAY